MISYELAKKLKDAGFPQNDWMIPAEAEMGGRNWPTPPTCGRHLVMDEPELVDGLGSGNCKKRAAYAYKLEYLDSEQGKELTVYIPTLSELIKACGDTMVLHKLNDVWIAGIGIKWNTFSDGIDTQLDPITEGITPEEAVANLWLELNPK